MRNPHACNRPMNPLAVFYKCSNLVFYTLSTFLWGHSRHHFCKEFAKPSILDKIFVFDTRLSHSYPQLRFKWQFYPFWTNRAATRRSPRTAEPQHAARPARLNRNAPSIPRGQTIRARPSLRQPGPQATTRSRGRHPAAFARRPSTTIRSMVNSCPETIR